MRILALNAYHGGSHRAFLEGWIAHSRHDFDVLSLPPRYWKWRMRQSPITFAAQVRKRILAGAAWDALFCTDMLSLAEFLALAPAEVRELPSVVYFHENQLTYPISEQAGTPDAHAVMTNITTALAATAVWFNSAYHRDDWLGHLCAFFAKMPDHRPEECIDIIRDKSLVQHPGIDARPPRGPRRPGPLRIGWAARWEADKNPEDFFAALRQVKAAGLDFRISVLGQSANSTLSCFDRAHREFVDRIDHWGFMESRDAYFDCLAECDVFVSTARHEFFGLSLLEAVAAGAFPLAPDRLAYPEVLGQTTEFLYDGSVVSLARRLVEIGRRLQETGAVRGPNSPSASVVTEPYYWNRVASAMDEHIATLR